MQKQNSKLLEDAINLSLTQNNNANLRHNRRRSNIDPMNLSSVLKSTKVHTVDGKGSNARSI